MHHNLLAGVMFVCMGVFSCGVRAVKGFASQPSHATDSTSCNPCQRAMHAEAQIGRTAIEKRKRG